MARTSKTSSAKKTGKNRPESAAKKTTETTRTVATNATDKKIAAPRRSRPNLAIKLNPNRLLAELVGTFILTMAVIAALSGKFTLSFFATPDVAAQAAAVGQTIPSFGLMPFVAGLALTIVVLATYKISGGILNPAITIGQMALRRQSVIEGIGYILAQVLGAMLALSVAKQLITVIDRTTGEMVALDPANLFSHAATWPVFFGEMLGAFVFGFGVAAALAYRALPRAVLFGGSFLIGIGVALIAGAGILNPALAVGTGLIGFGEGNLWALAGIYLGGSILGVLVGMAFHALLARGVSQEDARAQA